MHLLEAVAKWSTIRSTKHIFSQRISSEKELVSGEHVSSSWNEAHSCRHPQLAPSLIFGNNCACSYFMHKRYGSTNNVSYVLFENTQQNGLKAWIVKKAFRRQVNPCKVRDTGQQDKCMFHVTMHKRCSSKDKPFLI